jgi:hypothetical protein
MENDNGDEDQEPSPNYDGRIKGSNVLPLCGRVF